MGHAMTKTFQCLMMCHDVLFVLLGELCGHIMTPGSEAENASLNVSRHPTSFLSGYVMMGIRRLGGLIEGKGRWEAMLCHDTILSEIQACPGCVMTEWLTGRACDECNVMTRPS